MGPCVRRDDAENVSRSSPISNFKQQMRVRVLAARLARGLHLVVPRKNEGAGNAGCALHPRSRVLKVERNRTRAYRAAEAIRHSLRNGFTTYFALSPEYRAFLPPSHCRNRHAGPVGLCVPRQDLTPTAEASGPHDFAVRFGIARQHAVDRSQVIKPALPSHRAHDAAASTTSHPNVR
jgi:hypothetical protein